MTDGTQAQLPAETLSPTDSPATHGSKQRTAGAVAVMLGSSCLAVSALTVMGDRAQTGGDIILVLLLVPVGGLLVTVGASMLAASSMSDPVRRHVRTRATLGIGLIVGALVHLLFWGPYTKGTLAAVVVLGPAILLGVPGLALLWHAYRARSKAT